MVRADSTLAESAGRGPARDRCDFVALCVAATDSRPLRKPLRRDCGEPPCDDEAAVGFQHHGSLPHIAKAHALREPRRLTQAAAELRAYVLCRPDGDGSEQVRALLERIQGGIAI